MPYSSPTHPEVLRYVSPAFIVATLLAALFLNVLPWEGVGLVLRPDFVAVVLLYWCMHKPLRVGIGIAWLVGVISDVADASLFGQHALAYTVMAFCGIVLHRRLRMFNLRQQTVQVFGIFALTYLIFTLVHWQTSHHVVWSYFLGCISSTLLWAPVSLLFNELLRIQADKKSS